MWYLHFTKKFKQNKIIFKIQINRCHFKNTTKGPILFSFEKKSHTQTTLNIIYTKAQ